MRQVCEKLGVSRATLYRLREDPHFPPPCYITSRTPRWVADEIDRWVAQRRTSSPELRVRPDLIIEGTPRPPKERRLAKQRAAAARRAA